MTQTINALPTSQTKPLRLYQEWKPSPARRDNVWISSRVPRLQYNQYYINLLVITSTYIPQVGIGIYAYR